MERPILVVVIGYLIGIIWGLYFRSIVPFLLLIITIYFFVNKYFKSVHKFKLISIKRYSRYLKLIMHKKFIILIILSSLISNTIVLIKENKYNQFYTTFDKVDIEAVVISEKEEKQYTNVYKVKIEKINGSTYFSNKYLKVNINKKYKLNYGDRVSIKGEYIEPNCSRNYKGFDYKNYLKTLGIYGTINCKEINILKINTGNFIPRLANNIAFKAKENIKKLIDKDISNIFIGIIFGDTQYIEESIKEDFRISNISHILAVSGMHISYIILGISFILNNIVGKRKGSIITIFILIFYMFITGFSPSVIRAGIMGILMLLSKLVYRKNDIWTSINISLLIILIYNPYLIMNMGLQFSYCGTLGIILFNKSILRLLKNIQKVRIKKRKIAINRKWIILKGKILEMISVIISAQILIIPISIFHSNIFSLYFILCNLLVSVIIGPIIISGFILIIVSFINIKLSYFLSILLELQLNILLHISKIGKLPLSKIYFPTPSVYTLFIYYVIITIFFIYYNIKNLKSPNNSQIRLKNLMSLAKYRFNQNKNKFIYSIFIILLVIIIIIYLAREDLKIYFVDVGQGDCTFVVTPNNKKILIDGGGSPNKNFDIGKSVLLPYILDRGYVNIDYIFISHFDQDHVRTG